MKWFIPRVSGFLALKIFPMRNSLFHNFGLVIHCFTFSFFPLSKLCSQVAVKPRPHWCKVNSYENWTELDRIAYVDIPEDNVGRSGLNEYQKGFFPADWFVIEIFVTYANGVSYLNIQVVEIGAEIRWRHAKHRRSPTCISTGPKLVQSTGRNES